MPELKVNAHSPKSAQPQTSTRDQAIYEEQIIPPIDSTYEPRIADFIFRHPPSPPPPAEPLGKEGTQARGTKRRFDMMSIDSSVPRSRLGPTSSSTILAQGEPAARKPPRMFGLLAGENIDMLCQAADGSLVVRMAPNRDKGKQIVPKALAEVRNHKVTVAPPSSPTRAGALESTMLPRVRIKFTLPRSAVFQPSSNDTDTDIELTQEEVAMVSGSQLSSTTTASMDVNVDLPATFQDLSLSNNSNSDGKQSCPPLSSSPPSSCSTKSDLNPQVE